jgi:hypothetical protein
VRNCTDRGTSTGMAASRSPAPSGIVSLYLDV